MKQNEYTCAVIRDLIPLCEESLCSPESRAAVEAHIKHCESCRKLCGALPQDPFAEPVSVPDEASTFRKVGQHIRRNKRAAVTLLILLILLLGALGYLTAGQILKEPDIQSFETLAQSADVRPLVRKLTDGDYEGFVSSLSAGVMVPPDVYQYLQSSPEKDAELLKNVYEAAFGATEVRRIRIESNYTAVVLNDVPFIMSDVLIKYRNGCELCLDFYREADGLYKCIFSYTGGFDDSETNEQISNTITYICDHQLQTAWTMQRVMVNQTPFTDSKEDQSRLDNRCSIIKNRFAPDCAQQVGERLKAFYQKGYLITKCDLSAVRFDPDSQFLYYTLYVTASDGQGTAMLSAVMPFTYEGLRPLSTSLNTVCTDGCTPELAEDLRQLF